MERSELKGVGSQYRVVNGLGHLYISNGDIITLYSDDGTDILKFKVGEGIIEYVDIDRLEPIEDTPQKGDTVLVRDRDHEDWEERIYIGTLGTELMYPHFTLSKNSKLEDGDCLSTHWAQMKPSVEPKEVEVTLQEIAELKGVSVDQIRIKD